ncbi:MAG: ATP-binding protein, partial [Myxococcota bacterium]
MSRTIAVVVEVRDLDRAPETGQVVAVRLRAEVVEPRERLTKLGLVHAAETLGEHVAAAVKETHAPHRFLDTLLEAELAARDERRVRTSLRLSGLPTGQTIASFDFGFQPSVERSRIETLATCAWIRERES